MSHMYTAQEGLASARSPQAAYLFSFTPFMKRLVARRWSAASGRDERPAELNSLLRESTASSSAERPANPLSNVQRPNLKITSIPQSKRWLAEWHVVSCNNANAQCIRETVTILSHLQIRQKDVRSLQKKYHVAWDLEKKLRPLSEVIQELQSKVVQAAQKLQ